MTINKSSQFLRLISQILYLTSSYLKTPNQAKTCHNNTYFQLTKVQQVPEPSYLTKKAISQILFLWRNSCKWLGFLKRSRDESNSPSSANFRKTFGLRIWVIGNFISPPFRRTYDFVAPKSMKMKIKMKMKNLHFAFT